MSNKVDEVLQLINSEIQYCYKEMTKAESEKGMAHILIKIGFVQGLEQAKLLVKKYRDNEFKEVR
jgi:hypothetical protein